MATKLDIKLDKPIQADNRIGGGAFGTVYKVYVNGTECIAKRLHDILTGSRGQQYVSHQEWEQLVVKFRQECSLLSQMRHPNVVQFLGIYQPRGSDPRDVALIMEKLYIDLGHFIEEYKNVLAPLNGVDTFLSLKLHILHDICCGLLYIHSHSVIHRDLNAGNVLLTESLRAKVADLGMARIIDQSVATGRLTQGPGAMDYMPPEALCRNPTYNVKLDTFSFGHLMLYLLSCVYPKPAEPSRQTMLMLLQSTKHLSAQALKRKESLDDLGSDHILYNLIVSCLEDKPDPRPRMEDVKSQLESHCDQHPKTIDKVSLVLNRRRISELEEATAKHEQEIIEKMTEITKKCEENFQKILEDKETELKQKYDQDLQMKLEDKEAELKQKYNQDLETKLEDKEIELKQKHEQDIQKKLEDKEAELKLKYVHGLQTKLENIETELKQKYDQDLEMKLRNTKTKKIYAETQQLCLSPEHESLEEKSKTVDALRGQIAKVVQQLNDATETINSKQRKITELQENMEVQEFQMRAFKEDFERERADREGMNSKITVLEGQILTLQESLDDERHEKESVKAKMEVESLQIEEQVAEWEEEKLVLTSQVNGYSRQCDELKKTLLQIHNKCKSLEDQLKHKTGLEIEINQLKIEFQQKENEMKAQIHQKESEINSLNVKCSETEKNFRKTESFVTQLQQELQSECDDKQHLLSAFRQEQAKVANLENEMIKMRNANKILMEKVSSQKISSETPGHNVGYSPAHEITNISQRRNYPHQSASEGYPVQHAMTATNNTNADILIAPGQVHVYKEQLSGSYDIPPPQMNIEQMREFGRKYDNPQREQQEEQWRKQQRLQQMEQQRQIEQATADKALEELEQVKLEQKRMKHSPSQHQSNVTRNTELVSRTSKPVTSEPDSSDDIPENPLLEGVDQDILYYTEEAHKLTRPPKDTKELDIQDSLPYDPNLVCPKCGKRYRIGQIQRFKCHVQERCPNRNK